MCGGGGVVEASRPQVGTWVGGQEACDGTPGASTPVFLALWDLTCGPSPEEPEKGDG